MFEQVSTLCAILQLIMINYIYNLWDKSCWFYKNIEKTKSAQVDRLNLYSFLCVHLAHQIQHTTWGIKCNTMADAETLSQVGCHFPIQFLKTLNLFLAEMCVVYCSYFLICLKFIHAPLLSLSAALLPSSCELLSPATEEHPSSIP